MSSEEEGTAPEEFDEPSALRNISQLRNELIDKIDQNNVIINDKLDNIKQSILITNKYQLIYFLNNQIEEAIKYTELERIKQEANQLGLYDCIDERIKQKETKFQKYSKEINSIDTYLILDEFLQKIKNYQFKNDLKQIIYEKWDKEYPLTKEERISLEGQNGVLFIPYGKKEIMPGEYKDQNDIKIIVFPNTVKCIHGALDGSLFAHGAFSYCKNLTQVFLPRKLQVIGEDAFFGCQNLKDIKIPSSVTRIGTGAFRKCKNLKNIDIPSNEKLVIYNNAFDINVEKPYNVCQKCYDIYERVRYL